MHMRNICVVKGYNSSKRFSRSLSSYVKSTKILFLYPLSSSANLKLQPKQMRFDHVAVQRQKRTRLLRVRLWGFPKMDSQANFDGLAHRVQQA